MYTNFIYPTLPIYTYNMEYVHCNFVQYSNTISTKPLTLSIEN